MKRFVWFLLGSSAVATAAFLTIPATAASFSCMETERLNAAEQRICGSWVLGALDERLDSWYRRAIVRAEHFDQTDELRSEQRAWIASRDSCGPSTLCIRRHYLQRIRALRTYVEHV